MSSKVERWNGYWRYCYTSAARQREGLPRQKWLTFSASDYRKSDVQEIRRELDKKYRKGEWDPWTDAVPIERKEEQSLKEACEGFLSYKEKSHPANTVRVYKVAFAALQESFTVTPSADELTRFVNEAKTYNTRMLRKVAVEHLFTWLGEPVKIEVYGKRVDRKKKITTITENQLLEILPKARDAADVLRVGFYMGLRLNELVHLRPAWVVENRFLRVGDLKAWNLPDTFHPKSQKEHDDLIAIPPQVEDVFQGKGKYKRLFGLRNDRQARWVLQKAFRHLPDPLNKTFRPHDLRHSCASFWLNERNVPIQEVQRLLRHSNIATTMRYFHPDKDAHWRAFHRQFE